MLSEDELYDWMAVYTLDPWGPERADLNAGIIASTIVNVQRDPRKGKPVGPDVFMPKYGQEATEMPAPEKLKDQLLASFGHMIKRKPEEGG